MTLKSAEKAIRNGAIAGFIVAGLTILIVTVAVYQGPGGPFERWNDPLDYGDAALTTALSFGVLYRSRAAAVFLFLYFLTAHIMRFMESGAPRALFLTVILLYFFGRAVWGTFSYHRIKKEMDPEYRAVPRRMYFLWVPVAAVATIFAGLLVLGTISPSTAVLSGDEIARQDLGFLRGSHIVGEEEEIILFYSAGLLSIREDGNILTNERVISYEEIDGRIAIYEAPLAEIESIITAEKGDLLSDSLLLVTRRDGNSFYLYISTENDGDIRFLQEARKRIGS